MAEIKTEFSFLKVERSINCMIYGSIKIYRPISSIIDTPQFQRLRDIKQLGIGNLVYPTADHSRFEHSLGFAAQLLAKRPDKVDPKDVLCVGIAALCHDLGHGPFSHTFDMSFMRLNNPQRSWTHEEGSICMWNFLLQQNPDVKACLNQYLDEIDYVLIEELINPRKPLLDEGNSWKMKGRPIEKSFLYDLVSNVQDGFDVDKMDYFLRDSAYTKVPIQFSIDWMNRLLENVEIGLVDNGFHRIIYKKKVYDDYSSIVDCRRELHFKVYRHKTVIALEHQLVEILSLANPYLLFVGANGQEYKMSEAVDDMVAYCKMKDSVLDLIRLSTNPGMLPAQKLLDDMEHRRIYPCIFCEIYRTAKIANAAKVHLEEFFLTRGIDSTKYVVVKSEFHQGLGLDDHPLRHIWVYDKNDDKPRRLSSNEIGISHQINFVIIHVFWHSYEHNSELEHELLKHMKKLNQKPDYDDSLLFERAHVIDRNNCI